MKEYIYQKFIEYVIEKETSKIQIKDFTTFANISRQSFYNHFDGKQEMIEYIILNDLCMFEMDMYRIKNAWKKYYSNILDNLYAHQDFYRIIVNEGIDLNNIIFYAFYNEIMTYAKNVIYPDTLTIEIENEIVFFCGGIQRLLFKWIINGKIENKGSLTTTIIDFKPTRLIELMNEFELRIKG